ncbi:uncharacterized protein [Narcine bancroftii]|uniref:uncharacterized protein n=1 Tax=Narcine bancroftii TaxID=1343680 RepID=UPI003831D5BF
MCRDRPHQPPVTEPPSPPHSKPGKVGGGGVEAPERRGSPARRGHLAPATAPEGRLRRRLEGWVGGEGGGDGGRGGGGQTAGPRSGPIPPRRLLSRIRALPEAKVRGTGEAAAKTRSGERSGENPATEPGESRNGAEAAENPSWSHDTSERDRRKPGTDFTLIAAVHLKICTPFHQSCLSTQSYLHGSLPGKHENIRICRQQTMAENFRGDHSVGLHCCLVWRCTETVKNSRGMLTQPATLRTPIFTPSRTST